MALMNCPDCEKQMSDTAPACLGCGRPMQRIPYGYQQQLPPQPPPQQYYYPPNQNHFMNQSVTVGAIETGSFFLGFLGGFFLGCFGLVPILIFAKGANTKLGAVGGFAAAAILYLVVVANAGKL